MSTFTLQDLDLPMTAEEAIKAIDQAQHAELPQPTLGEVLPNPDLPTIINNICTQLQLLTSVITSVEEDFSSNATLQETVELVLKQSDWFQQMVRGIVDDTYDFADHAENAVEAVVEKEVEHYFDSRFNPEDHFDFGDAVSDAVADRIDDAVEAHMDDAVESYMSNATITINK